MPTARTYDFILTVASAAGFVTGNTIYGVTSDTTATIANVDLAAKQIKVKVDNVQREFKTTETIKQDKEKDNLGLLTFLLGLLRLLETYKVILYTE